jgi:very-short-patch-repair endonuclease
MSLPEVLLWQRLKGGPQGISFRKQHPIGSYRADFYCAAAKLVIEVDGIAHDMGNRPQRDEKRTAVLEQQGYTILRLPAADILRDPDEAAASVIAFARSSPGRGGGPPPQAVVEGAADARNDPPVDRPLHHASGMVPLLTSGEDHRA